MSDRLTAGVVRRLCWYLQVLKQARSVGKERISSQEISAYTKINASQIRRDLSRLGKFGRRGYGYSIDDLLSRLRGILRTQQQRKIALVGAGRLGQAIINSPLFAEHGLKIAAVFDPDPDLIGRQLAPTTGSVLDLRSLPEVAREKEIIVGVIALPAADAQQAAETLIDAGIRIIVNYSEALLDAPHHVRVLTSNPALALAQALSSHPAPLESRSPDQRRPHARSPTRD